MMYHEKQGSYIRHLDLQHSQLFNTNSSSRHSQFSHPVEVLHYPESMSIDILLKDQVSKHKTDPNAHST